MRHNNKYGEVRDQANNRWLHFRNLFSILIPHAQEWGSASKQAY